MSPSIPIPSNPEFYRKFILWVYSNTLARHWGAYKRISLRGRKVIELEEKGINSIRSFWNMVANNELNDNCSVRIFGVVSEFVPLIPGAVASVEPQEWSFLIDENVEKVLKKIDETVKRAAISVKQRFTSSKLDLSRIPNHVGTKEWNVQQYFYVWAKIIGKHALFVNESDKEGAIRYFREIIKDDITNYIANWSVPHGVLRSPVLEGQREYRYLGISYEIADYGIPILVRNNVYESKFRPIMEYNSNRCNADVVIHLRYVEEFPVPDNMQELRQIITAFTPARVVGVIQDVNQVRHVGRPGELKGRIWAAFLFKTGDGSFTVHLPWRSQLNNTGIRKNVNEMENFVKNFAVMNGFTYELVAHFDQVYNWFIKKPKITIISNKVIKQARAMRKSKKKR
jgi:hypothetical protein